MQNLQVPPNNTEVENCLLGGLLFAGNEAVELVLETLRPEHFYAPTHARIYEAMLTMHRQNKPINVLLLTNYLKEQQQLETIGGLKKMALAHLLCQKASQ